MNASTGRTERAAPNLRTLYFFGPYVGIEGRKDFSSYHPARPSSVYRWKAPASEVLDPIVNRGELRQPSLEGRRAHAHLGFLHLNTSRRRLRVNTFHLFTEKYRMVLTSGSKQAPETLRGAETAAPAALNTSAVAVYDPRLRSDQKKPRKRAHYLRHSQRCAIIERIDTGEQQAALAREYNVTRAAISLIYKNRDEILAREVEEESEEENQEEELTHSRSVAVTELCDNAVLVLLTTLHDVNASESSFYRAANRIITILLEESVAMLGTRAVTCVGIAGETYAGLEREYEFCGITLNEEAAPFAAIFTDMEPNSPVGSIEVEEAFDGFGNPLHCRIRHMDVPANINCKTFLFTFICGDSGAEWKAVEALRTLGVEEKNIAIIAIQCSSRGLNMITNHFPEIRIITVIVDDHDTAGPFVVFPGLPWFIERHQADAAAREHAWEEEEKTAVE